MGNRGGRIRYRCRPTEGEPHTFSIPGESERPAGFRHSAQQIAQALYRAGRGERLSALSQELGNDSGLVRHWVVRLAPALSTLLPATWPEQALLDQHQGLLAVGERDQSGVRLIRLGPATHGWARLLETLEGPVHGILASPSVVRDRLPSGLHAQPVRSWQQELLERASGRSGAGVRRQLLASLGTASAQEAIAAMQRDPELRQRLVAELRLPPGDDDRSLPLLRAQLTEARSRLHSRLPELQMLVALDVAGIASVDLYRERLLELMAG